MKELKNIIKKGMVLCMASLMLFGATACGGKDKQKSDSIKATVTSPQSSEKKERYPKRYRHKRHTKLKG